MAKMDKKKLFLEHFEINATNIKRTCDAVGIGRGTYYRWVESDPDFKHDIDDIHEGFIDEVESLLYKNIQAGHEAYIFFFLKCKGKGRGYIEKHSIEATVHEKPLPDEDKALLDEWTKQGIVETLKSNNGELLKQYGLAIVEGSKVA